jgi:5-methylcytosine-specific restriction enzyme subunit McrC
LTVVSQPTSEVLHEYQDSVPIELTADERDALRQLVPQMTIRPEAGHDDVFVLNPRGAVGAIQLGDRRFELRPKIEIRRLAFVLAYSMDPDHWRNSAFDFKEEADLFEAVVPGFVFQVEEALKRGPLLGYRLEEDALQTVRGRIRFDDQLRNRFGIAPPVECRFDEYTEDIEINRILKAATTRLGRIRVRSPMTRRGLRTIAPAFANVSSVQYDARRIPDVRWDRLNERFRSATELARLILRSRSLEFQGGKVAGSAFLLDMSGVFEDFVVIALREALGLSERQFPQEAQGRKLFLDEGHRLALKPDLSWWEESRCVFVGDAKYKRTPEIAGVKHPDAYQLLAYTIATDLYQGMLIYAAGEEVGDGYSIPRVGKKLLVRTLDLDQDPDQVLLQIEHLANEIRASAAQARVRPVERLQAA